MLRALATALLLLHPQASDRWEKDIAAFEAKDKASPPPKGGAVFTGSSSIRMWKLDQAFPGLPVLNRGFGGSQMADAARYLERTVLPHAPKLVFVFSGSNDIASGKTPEDAVAAAKELAAKVHAALPKTRVYFISLGPNPKRWSMDDRFRRYNALMEAYMKTDPRLGWIDVRPPMSTPDGGPRPELLLKDGLHMNADGYAIWNRLVEPILRDALK